MRDDRMNIMITVLVDIGCSFLFVWSQWPAQLPHHTVLVVVKSVIMKCYY